ncbi:hypothetical protein FACS189475_02870 [Betaproteobacteria bacterium]|nr:hypothetical protein FACS189475_02870 [Betaproteobacteria bacterium]
MIVYHGGYCEVQKPELKPTRNHKDFGPGFYCAGLLAQAERWSKRFGTSIISVYDYVPDASFDILQFDTMTEEWLDFIVACRNGTAHTHDIVVGAMANDQVWNYVADFFAGVLTREQFWVLAKFKYPTHQIAFCTPCSLHCLNFQESREVKK